MSEFGGLRKHENTSLRTKQKGWVAPYCGCSLSPVKAARMFRALHRDKNVMWCNLKSDEIDLGAIWWERVTRNNCIWLERVLVHHYPCAFSIPTDRRIHTKTCCKGCLFMFPLFISSLGWISFSPVFLFTATLIPVIISQACDRITFAHMFVLFCTLLLPDLCISVSSHYKYRGDSTGRA